MTSVQLETEEPPSSKYSQAQIILQNMPIVPQCLQAECHHHPSNPAFHLSMQLSAAEQPVCFSHTGARFTSARCAHSGCDFSELEGVPSVWMANSLAVVAWRHYRYHGICLACL